MSTYGHVIKFERIRQNIKQVQLSDGICTPSYLSKIESNSIVPSQEILGEFLKRLDILPSKSLLSEEESLEHVRSIYIEAIKYKDKEQASEYLKEVLEEQFQFANPSNFYTYILMIIRVKIMVHDITKDTPTYIFAISKFIDDFTTYQSFLYHSCLGYFHFYKNDLINSLQSLAKAELFHKNSKVEESETADFYYVFGIMNLHHNKLVVTLDLLSKAQTYFNKELLLFRAVESYITTAVAYKRALNYEKYYENLTLAEKLAIDGDMTENLSLIYFNLATYYSLKNNIELAIEYYHMGLNQTSDHLVQLKTIYSIILQNSIIYKYDDVVAWCKKGLVLYNSDPNELSKTFYYHFQIHLSIHSNYESFEKIIIDAVQYFVEMKDLRHAHKYSIRLANFYNAVGKYKKATTYFKHANEYLAKEENRRFIEEI